MFDTQEAYADLRSTLNTLPRSCAARMATRASLRVLPDMLDRISRRRTYPMATLEYFRIFILASEIATEKHPNEALLNEAYEVAKYKDGKKTSYGAIQDAVHAIYTSIYAIRKMDTEEEALKAVFAETVLPEERWEAAALDCEIEPHEDIMTVPLWHNRDIPERLLGKWNAFKEENYKISDPIRILIDWYEGLLAGAPNRRGLQRDLSKLPAEAWSSPDRDASRIFRAVELKDKTGILPDLEHNPETGLIRFSESQNLPDHVEEFHIKKIETILDSCPNPEGGNGFNNESYEHLLIRNTINKHKNNNALFADLLLGACLALDKNIGDKYPEEIYLVDLKNALYNVVEEICEINEFAREQCSKRWLLASRRNAPEISTKDVNDVADMLNGSVESEVLDLIEFDSENIKRNNFGTLASKARITNIISSVIILVEKGKKIETSINWLIKKFEQLAKLWESGEKSE